MNTIDFAAHNVIHLLEKTVETDGWHSLTDSSYRLIIEDWGRLFLSEKDLTGTINGKNGENRFIADDEGLHDALSKLYEKVKHKIYIENELNLYKLIEKLKSNDNTGIPYSAAYAIFKQRTYGLSQENLNKINKFLETEFTLPE